MMRLKAIRLAAACVGGLMSVPLLLGLGTRPAKADWVAMWNNLDVPMIAAVRTACPTVGPQGAGINYGTPQVYVIRPHTSGGWQTPANCADKVLDLMGAAIPKTGVWQLAAAFFSEDGTLYVGGRPLPAPISGSRRATSSRWPAIIR